MKKMKFLILPFIGEKAGQGAAQAVALPEGKPELWEAEKETVKAI